VWAFIGDGEMASPRHLARSVSPRYDELDNLIFVVNCNLQQLDGPVRGNGKIIQELESVFTWRRVERHQSRLGSRLG
jgi:pyruvate dehydrogenase E1 component